MLQQDDLYARDVAVVGPAQEQREQAALIEDALRLQELFVALWEAKRRGKPLAGSI